MASKDKEKAKAKEKEQAAVVETAANEGAAAPQQEREPVNKAEEAESFTLTKSEFEQVQQRMEQLKKDKDETVALLQRNQADFDNFRRRNAQVRHDSFEDGKRETVTALLPVLDDFDRVLENAGTAEDGWLDGVKLVRRKLWESLEKLGLAQIEAEGAFDANLHNAVMAEEAEGKESGTILAVLQKGYRMGDKIIRHSMVKVAK